MVEVYIQASAIASLVTGRTIMRETQRIGVNFVATESVNSKEMGSHFLLQNIHTNSFSEKVLHLLRATRHT